MAAMDQFLSQTIARAHDLPADATVKIVAEPAQEEQLNALADYLSSNAVEPTVIRSHKVRANVPVSKLDEISRNSMIRSVRLARTHSVA